LTPPFAKHQPQSDSTYGLCVAGLCSRGSSAGLRAGARGARPRPGASVGAITTSSTAPSSTTPTSSTTSSRSGRTTTTSTDPTAALAAKLRTNAYTRRPRPSRNAPTSVAHDAGQPLCRPCIISCCGRVLADVTRSRVRGCRQRVVLRRHGGHCRGGGRARCARGFLRLEAQRQRLASRGRGVA
jgi:hypothetical protein